MYRIMKQDVAKPSLGYAQDETVQKQCILKASTVVCFQYVINTVAKAILSMQIKRWPPEVSMHGQKVFPLT